MKKKRILAFLLTMALAVSQLAGTHGLTVQAGLGVEDEGNGTDITFEACTHNSKQEITAVTPTCTTPGNIHYYYCETCNAYWDGEENITSQADTILAATGHDMGQLIEQAPTCTEPGVKAHYHCEKCQKDFEDNAKDTTKEITDTVDPATGHKYNNAEWVQGITHHWYKMVCECSKKTTEEQEEIAKEEAEKSGYAEHTGENTDNKCDVCGAAMHKHEMEQIDAKPSSCIEEGNNKYYYCSGCKKYYKDKDGKNPTTPEKEKLELGKHEFVKEATKEHICKDATCTETAVYYVSCKTCKENGTETFTSGTAKGHTYQNKVEAKYLKAGATCTSPAVYYTSCKECGAKGTTTFTSGTAKEHTYQNKVEAKYLKAGATCTSPAVYYTSCKECGAKGTTTFTSGTAKAHTYRTVVKAATTKKDGQTVEKCSSCGAEKNKTTIKKASKVSLKKTTLYYTGKAQKPAVIVKDSKDKTINSKYYTVTWTKGCKTVGTYKATVTFKGNYSGTKTLSFKINPKKISIKKPTAAKKAFTVKWSKQKKSLVDGYQVWYSTDKKFKKAVSKKTVKNNGKVASYKASKLKGNKTYYVKVRSYKKVGKTTYYSDWSSVQKVKAKK